MTKADIVAMTDAELLQQFTVYKNLRSRDILVERYQEALAKELDRRERACVEQEDGGLVGGRQVSKADREYHYRVMLRTTDMIDLWVPEPSEALALVEAAKLAKQHQFEYQREYVWEVVPPSDPDHYVGRDPDDEQMDEEDE